MRDIGEKVGGGEVDRDRDWGEERNRDEEIRMEVLDRDIG